MSDVVGSGWTHVTFLRTVGVGSPGLASLTPLSGGVVVLLGSCSLSFSHLWWFSLNQVLAYGNLFLGNSCFAPLLEPVAGFFLAGQLDPSRPAGSDLLQASLRCGDLSRLSLDPRRRTSVPDPLVRDYDLCCEVLPCEPPRRVESKSKIALR